MSKRDRASTANNKSPAKQRPGTSAQEGQASQETINNLQLGISEKEIEIERLKITVVSLNTKCTVVDDYIEDLKNTTARFRDSEANREKLQNHIVQAAKKVESDNLAHTDYQGELQNEIEALKQQLQQQRQEQH